MNTPAIETRVPLEEFMAVVRTFPGFESESRRDGETYDIAFTGEAQGGIVWWEDVDNVTTLVTYDRSGGDRDVIEPLFDYLLENSLFDMEFYNADCDLVYTRPELTGA